MGAATVTPAPIAVFSSVLNILMVADAGPSKPKQCVYPMASIWQLAKNGEGAVAPLNSTAGYDAASNRMSVDA